MISHTKETSSVEYGLAFVYDKEYKDARIRAYLDKYLIKNPDIIKMEKLKAYVEQILTIPRSVTTTASYADPHKYVI